MTAPPPATPSTFSDPSNRERRMCYIAGGKSTLLVSWGFGKGQVRTSKQVRVPEGKAKAQQRGREGGGRDPESQERAREIVTGVTRVLR